MPEWTAPTNGEVIIAHISDLHFGSTNYELSWEKLAECLRDQVRPQLILVTGDIVDWPKQILYEKAKRSLDDLAVPYFVCAGNHDRHLKGIVSQTWSKITWRGDTHALFDHVFGPKVLSCEQATKPTLGTRSPWTLGLIGVDSSIRADFAARGYVPREIFKKVRSLVADQGTSWDIGILLVHHHLQSVRQLEESRHGNLTDLANATCLVNAGSFLECLARARIDLVLHGHDHAPHWARYGTLEGSRGEILVVGAGSATGNHHTRGCNINDASFNAILLAPDRSARLRTLRWDDQDWKVTAEVPLFDAFDGRRIRLLRSSSPVTSALNSRVVKHVEFTRQRDIRVSWLFTNRLLKDQRFPLSVENSTGRPRDARLTLTRSDGYSGELKPEAIRDRNRPNRWAFDVQVGESFVNQPVKAEFSYVWKAGALLTAQEMDAFRGQAPAPGILRTEGLEFTAISTAGALASAELVVVLPSGFEPRDPVQLKVYDEDLSEREAEAGVLRGLVEARAGGHYSFRLPYPRENWLYALAWRPVTAPRNPRVDTFRVAADRKGEKALGEFRTCWGSKGIARSARLSLYIASGDGKSADRVAHSEPEIAPGHIQPNLTVPLDGYSTALGQAFWGVSGGAIRLADKARATEAGLLEDEEALLALPIELGFESATTAPLGVIRIGIREPLTEQARQDLSDEDHRVILPLLRLLTSILDMG